MATTISKITNDSLSTNIELYHSLSSRGQPCGTTQEEKKEDEETLKQCVNSITKDYAKKQTSDKLSRHGYLKTLIKGYIPISYTNQCGNLCQYHLLKSKKE